MISSFPYYPFDVVKYGELTACAPSAFISLPTFISSSELKNGGLQIVKSIRRAVSSSKGKRIGWDGWG